MPIPSSVAYTAVAGDTWDTISYRYYEYNERYASTIIRANPDLMDMVVFEGGEQIVVPIIDTAKTPDTLPPWRRQ